MPSPSAPVVPSVASADANSLDVSPHVSANTMPRVVSCSKAVLIAQLAVLKASLTLGKSDVRINLSMAVASEPSVASSWASVKVLAS